MGKQSTDKQRIINTRRASMRAVAALKVFPPIALSFMGAKVVKKIK